MPSGATTKSKKAAKPEIDEAKVLAEAEAVLIEEKTPRKRRSTPRVERPKRRPVALPVLVVDETVLLPHMSIPFPIEDEEAAMVLDRASRMVQRQVLVLTERPVKKALDPLGDAGEFRELFADLGLTDIPVDDPAPADDAAEWVSDEELADEEFELCSVGVIAEVGQRITRPGGHAHVILQGGRARDSSQLHPAGALSRRPRQPAR